MKALFLPVLALTLGAQGPEGNFLGTLSTPAGQLRLGLVLSREAGVLVADFISLDQGYATLRAAETKLAERQLTVAVPQAQASFAGEFTEDFSRLAGKFTQGQALDLALERVSEIPRPRRPQHPQPPFPYRSESVRFPSAAPGVELAGTLTLPHGEGPFPAVILLSGSGPHDRDETILEHKPFLVLSDFLTRQGIAVLRYDDRGTAQSSGSFAASTTEDFAQDARGALAFLRAQSQIHPQRLALIGHSEGGLIAPMVAANDESLRALVLLAAPGVPGEAILKKQTYDLPRAAGLDEEKAKAQAELGMLQLSLRKAADPWMNFFWTYDPAPTLAKVKCPILALNGSLDMQVNADINLAAIQSANPQATVKKLDRLNHLFQTTETGAGVEYGRLEETFAPAALSQIASWLQEQFAKPATPPAAPPRPAAN